jgi:hypothetical protein
MIQTNLPFPISTTQEVFNIRSVPSVEGVNIKNTRIVETTFPEGNSTRRVDTYNVTVYDATGRLYSYLYGYSNIDRLI